MAQEEAQATLREALTDSIAQHSEPAPEPAAPAEETAAAPEPAAEPQKPGRTAGRPRAPDGKLLPGKPAKDSAAQATPIDAGATSVEPPPVAAEPAIQPIPRPSSWKKEMWGIWDKMATGQPLDAKEARQVAEYNAQREQQFAGGVSTYKQEAERAKPLLEAIAPFQADLDKHGIQAPQMVHRLMAAHRALALGSPQEKVQQFTRLLQDYGIPLQALYDPAVQQQYIQSAPAQQSMPQQQAPDINALVEKALSEREVKQTVASMERDTEKYPAFQYVRNTMAQLLETNAATDLDDAYQQALSAPEHAFLTQALQQQQAQATEAQRVAAAQKTAAVARANTVSPRSATPAAAAAPSGKSTVRDALRESIAAITGGARV